MNLVRLPPLGGEGWGGGIRFLQSPSNLINNQLHTLIQLVVPESQHLKSARLQPGRALRVAHGRLTERMMHAVEFNHELVRVADETSDAGTDRRLAPKLVSVELLSAERSP
jgi:hypothetical protein